MESFKRVFVTAVNWGLVTVTVRSSAYSSAAGKTTTETLLMADAALCLSFEYSCHGARIISLQLSEGDLLALVFSFWSPSCHPLSSRAFPSVPERSNSQNGERIL